MEVYAPRAALYETLPDFLHRLTGPARHSLVAPRGPNSRGLSSWARFSGGTGSYEAQRSTVGGGYDFERREVEVGLNLALGEQAHGWVSVRHVTGFADVSAPTGGGRIDATAMGPTFGAYWRGERNFYLVGSGSVTDYDIDFTSDMRGLLRAGVGGSGYSLGAEAGQRFELGGTTSLTPRAWLVRPSVSVDNFTDAVDSRVSYPDAVRLIGGLGAVVETIRPWGAGEFLLRSSVDFERIFSGAETLALVSGETLRTEAPSNGILVGVDSVYRWDRYSIGGKVSVGTAPGSGTRDFSGHVNFGIRF